MRIIEGMGPPTQDTFGNSDYLYKDTETGAFYRCHGNINEDRTLPYFPAHKHPGEQYVWTPIPYSTVGMVEETRHFTPSGPDGGFIDDLEFAKLLYGNLDKATYTYSGYFASDAVETTFETLQNNFAYIGVKDSNGKTDKFMVSIRTDSNGNLTGQVWFGNDHFITGSITIKAIKETVYALDRKFIPYTTFYGNQLYGSENDNKTIYIDKELTIPATVDDIFEAYKHGNITFVYNNIELIPQVGSDSDGSVLFLSGYGEWRASR